MAEPAADSEIHAAPICVNCRRVDDKVLVEPKPKHWGDPGMGFCRRCGELTVGRCGPHEEDVLYCGICTSTAILTSNEHEEFKYGVGDEQVTLSALVPFRKCQSCGFRFTDYAGEVARSEAVAAHLEKR